MDTQRLILFVIFSFSVLMLWDAWQREHRPAPAPQVQDKAGSGAVPAASVPAPGAPAAPPKTDAVPGSTGAAPARERVRVETDLLRAEIDPVGGDLVRLDLTRYKDSLHPDKPFELLGADHRYTVQSGLIGANLPNHRTLFTPEAQVYKLEDGKDKVEVRLRATTPEGVDVVKSLTFHRGSYVVDIAQEVENKSAAPIAPQGYFHVTRDGKAPADDQAMVSTYTGVGVFTDASKLKLVKFADMDKDKADYPKQANDGWIAMIQHYFVSALLPPDKAAREYYAERVAENYYRAGVKLPLAAIEPGGKATSGVRLFAGPQEQNVLPAVAPHLDLVVDYGWLTVIAVPLFWVLEWFHGWLGNWGLAIIALTVLIKLIFFPLSAASYKSMARMKKVTPRLTKIREMYGNDRAKMNQAMMELYKTEKINPLGGCFPILVQIPVFIALYWVLLAAIELRHAPFMLWIKDLSALDPYYVLPILMTVTMWLQQQMTPSTADATQKKILAVMPFIFGFMFKDLPSGLTLYWLVQNVLTILQQLLLNRFTDLGPATAKAGEAGKKRKKG